MGLPASLRGMQAEMLYPASPHVPGPAVTMRQAHADWVAPTGSHLSVGAPRLIPFCPQVIRDRVSHVLRRSKPPLKKPSGSIATLGLEELKDQVLGT